MNDVLKTDIGINREINQDYLDKAFNSQGDLIYVLCDGMGGYKGGEVAAFECSKYITTKFEQSSFIDINEAKDWLYYTILEANEKILQLSQTNVEYNKMGTTVICLIISEKFNVYASVGDSRIYTYNNKELNQLSEDQTFTNALLKAGYISEKEAKIHPKRNILISAIGSHPDDLDIQIKEIEGNNNYLLCSDGLYTMIDKKGILKILNIDSDLKSKADKLIDLANENGGKDNVSVILVEEHL